MGARETLSSLVDTGHGSEPALAQLLLRFVEPLPILDRHDHREGPMVALDHEALAGGGRVQD